MRLYTINGVTMVHEQLETSDETETPAALWIDTSWLLKRAYFFFYFFVDWSSQLLWGVVLRGSFVSFPFWGLGKRYIGSWGGVDWGRGLGGATNGSWWNCVWRSWINDVERNLVVHIVCFVRDATRKWLMRTSAMNMEKVNSRSEMNFFIAAMHVCTYIVFTHILIIAMVRL